MKFLGNFLWFCCGGVVMALIHLVLGLACYITILLIPFGKQFFKLAYLVAAPFGKEVDNDFDTHPYLNVLWMVIDIYALVTLLIGAILCVTIIGIPFGKQCFKIARLAAVPFGALVLKV